MNPKVSVLMITYNHEPFIRQALDSVLMQKTSFPVELVVGEDCSTDRTRDIVSEYQRKHPQIVRALLPERNQGQIPNVAATLAACRGDYIAILEGDDYWTAPDKLQCQTDFLDAHPECAISFHKALMIFEDNTQAPRECPEDAPEVSTLEDLLECQHGNLIPTCSAVWRRGLFERIPDWVEEVGFSDWPIHVMNARRGKIGFLNRCMAIYRVHPGGVWSSQDGRSVTDRWVKALEYMNRELNYEYDSLCRSSIFRRLYGYSVESLARRDADARHYAWRALRTGPPRLHAREKAILLLKMYVPAVLRCYSAAKRRSKVAAQNS
jgi:glycosyltransferase involved in cell wall biosynthesis